MKRILLLCLVFAASIAAFALLAQSYRIEFEVRQKAPLTATVQAQTVGRSSCRLVPTVEGGLPDYTYLWSPAAGLDNPNIAQPLLSLSQAEDKYYLTITDSQGCSLMVEYILQTTGTATAAGNKNPLKIHYDSQSKQLTLSCEEAVSASTITLYNMQGQKMETKQGDYPLRLSTAACPAGVYIISIQAADSQWNEKLIIE
jgi:hypothetical protein